MQEAGSNSTAQVTDFPDQFSPMLVKELRQGLRTNLFVTAFLLLQGFMILCILMGSSTPDSNDSANEFFWFFIIIAFLVVQPLRGFGALSSEYQLNTMDLIQLTRLNAWRITIGKWFAINAQTFLMLTAVLPYLLLRYFFGAVNVFADLGFIGLLAVSSALLSAVTVGCSAFRSVIIRVVLILVFGFAYSNLWFIVVDQLTWGTPSASDWAAVWLIVFGALFGVVFFLFLGASRIAPRSENYAVTKRLLGLGCAAVAWLFQFGPAGGDECMIVASAILGLVVIDAMTESPSVFWSVLKRFSGSWLKRFCGYILTPGWHSGVFFFVLPCFGLWLGAMLHRYNYNPNVSELGVIVYGAGMVTFPLLLIQSFFRKSKADHFTLYLVIQICVGSAVMLAMAISQSAGYSSDWVFLLIPLPGVLFFGNLAQEIESPIALIVGMFWLALSVLVPLAVGTPLFREMKRTFTAHSS